MCVYVEYCRIEYVEYCRISLQMISVMVLCVIPPMLLSINSAIDRPLYNHIAKYYRLENEDTLTIKHSNTMLRERK